MKKLGLITVLLLFTLAGCKNIQKAGNLTELSLKLDSYLDKANQFEIITSIDLDVTYDGKTEDSSESITAYAQKEPYYAMIETEDSILVETKKGSDLYTYTVHKDLVVENINLYEMNKITLDESQNPIDYISFNLNKVTIKKTSSNQFSIKGRLVDFMPKQVLKDLKDMLIESGVTEAEFNTISIAIDFLFDEDTLEYELTMHFDIQGVVINISLNVLFAYQTFDTLDLSDDTKYFPMSSNETEIPIDSTKPILFTSDSDYDTSYYTYLEAGKYGFSSNHGYYDSNLTLKITDESKDPLKYLVFKDIYNRHIDNTDNITHFYEIKEAGYYYIEAHYPLSLSPYIVQIEKLDFKSDGTNETDLVITSSGTYDYQLESRYDFFSIQFDLDNPAIINITDSNGNYIYRKHPSHSIYENIMITESGFDYIYQSNDPLYLNNPIYSFSGTLTVEIQEFIHKTRLEEPLLEMKDIPNEDYLYSGSLYPNQYISLTVDDTSRYTFYLSPHSGDQLTIKGELYDFNHKLISNISNETSVVLTRGTYYYKTYNLNPQSYSIHYVKDTEGFTSIDITSIAETTQIAGLNMNEMPHVNITFEKKYDVVILNFELTEKKDIVFGSSREYQLYDTFGNQISLDNLSGSFFLYQLQAGHYFIKANHPSYLGSTSFPYQSKVHLAVFTNSGSDTSIYGNYEDISFGFEGRSTTIDYPGDQDGFTFTLDEKKEVVIISNADTYLYLGNTLIKRQIEHETLVLEKGTYTLISNGYEPTWTVSVFEPIGD